MREWINGLENGKFESDSFRRVLNLLAGDDPEPDATELQHVWDWLSSVQDSILDDVSHLVFGTAPMFDALPEIQKKFNERATDGAYSPAVAEFPTVVLKAVVLRKITDCVESGVRFKFLAAWDTVAPWAMESAVECFIEVVEQSGLSRDQKLLSLMMASRNLAGKTTSLLAVPENTPTDGLSCWHRWQIKHLGYSLLRVSEAAKQTLTERS